MANPTPAAAPAAAPARKLPEGWTVNAAPAESAVVVTYGKSGAGKTVDDLYSLPGALFIAMPGALKAAQPLIGFSPTTTVAATVMHATQLVVQAKQAGYHAVVVDDFSALAESTMAAIQAAIAASGKGNNKFAVFDAMRNAVLQFRDTARMVGIHVVLNAWEQEPKVNEKGERLRGGPMLSGKLPEQLPAMCDLVLRIGYDAGRARERHPFSYFVQGGLDWVGKDRDTGTPNPAPVNLGEILRFNGYQIPRLRGLEWQEEQVQLLAERLYCGTVEQDNAEIEALYADLLKRGVDRRHALWTCRDGYHRAQLQRAARDRWSTFFPPAAAAAALPPLPGA
jgi:hypothetical protein